MPIPIDCPCGEQLNLRDELAGQVFRCPGCGRNHAVPRSPAVRREADQPPVVLRAEPRPLAPLAPASPVKFAVFIGAFVGLMLLTGLILYFVLREPEMADEDRPRGEDRPRNSANRSQNRNNLHQIGLALHSYHDSYGCLPRAADPGINGIPLSWRVAILPYLEEEALYQAWNRNEPWDGPNNRQLWNRMPKCYQMPGRVGNGTKTYYQVFVGNDTAFPPDRSCRLTDILDGTSNTIFVVEAGSPVVWCQPTDVAFQALPNGFDPKQVGGYFGKTVNVVMGDGSVREISWKVSPQMFQNAITRADGMIADLGD